MDFSKPHQLTSLWKGEGQVGEGKWFLFYLLGFPEKAFCPEDGNTQARVCLCGCVHVSVCAIPMGMSRCASVCKHIYVWELVKGVTTQHPGAGTPCHQDLSTLGSRFGEQALSPGTQPMH